MKTTATLTDTPKVFLTDYASYNEGTQFEFGHWVDLSDFSDHYEFFMYVKKHFKTADKKSPLSCGTPREEIMLTDYENYPKALYCESASTMKDIYKYMKLCEDYDLEDNTHRMWIYNEYCQETSNGDNEIFENDDLFFETFFKNAHDAVRATFYGDYRYMDPYVSFDGYGNLESLNDYDLKNLDIDDAIKWKLEQY